MILSSDAQELVPHHVCGCKSDKLTFCLRYDALEPHIDAATMKVHHGTVGCNRS